MWPRLHAIKALLNYPTPGDARHSQLWHRDPEDVRQIKVFIYLTDVDEQNGPFCYIPRSQPFGSKASIDPECSNPKRITDAEMSRAIPQSAWVSCTGPAGTMILADTVGFHRGGRVMTGTRVLINLTYTSGTPFGPSPLKFQGVPSWASHEIQRYALFPG